MPTRIENAKYNTLFICNRTTCSPIWKKLDEKNFEAFQNWTRPLAEWNLAVRGIFSNSIILKLDKHVVLLGFNYIAGETTQINR